MQYEADQGVRCHNGWVYIRYRSGTVLCKVKGKGISAILCMGNDGISAILCMGNEGMSAIVFMNGILCKGKGMSAVLCKGNKGMSAIVCMGNEGMLGNSTV